MKQIKALCLFDYKCHTGFASVSKNLMDNWRKQLKGQVQFDIVAINYFGEMLVEPDGTRIISAKLTDNQQDDFGRYVFLKTLLDGDYDVVFILQEPTAEDKVISVLVLEIIKGFVSCVLS